MAEKIVKDSQGLVKDLVNDCISRRAAVDVINESNSPIAEYLIGEIMALPSAQEKRTDKRTEMHACDLIDREAAVDAIYHHLPSVYRTEVRLMLHEVPSAQPEIIRCRDCKWHRFDKDNIPYCYNIDYGYGWKDDDFCSRAERREVSE